jgi:hypothetical protein
MWKGSFIGAFFVNIRYIHIKDSNKYQIWIIVRSINIWTGGGGGYEKLLKDVSEMRVCKFGLYTVEQRIALRR